MIKSLVSVIVPVHNTAPFLKECIDSILQQSYADIEVLLVDDNSTDESSSIIEYFQKKDGRIRTFKVNEGNAARTRHQGIKKSNGEYICFIDSDDLVHEEYVQQLLEAVCSYEVTVSSAKIKPFSGTYAKVDEIEDTDSVDIDTDMLHYFSENYHAKGSGSRQIAQSINAKMFKKEALLPIDYSVLKTSVLEDNWIMPQVLAGLSEPKIALIDKTLYYYRINTESTMSKAKMPDKLLQYAGDKVTYAVIFERAMEYVKSVFRSAGYNSTESKIDEVRMRQYQNMLEWSKRDRSLLESNLKSVELELDTTRKDLAKIVNSRSYKIGSIIAYPVRKMKTVWFRKDSRQKEDL